MAVNEFASPADDSVPLHPDDTRSAALVVALGEARERGDQQAAAAAWRAIADAELERVRGLVGGFRDPRLPGGRFEAAQIDGVVLESFARVHARIGRLRGHGVGELRALVRTATAHVCLERAQRAAGDDPDPDASAAILDALAARYATPELAEFAGAMVHPALAEVDDDVRAVLVMTQAGYARAVIAERLGLDPGDVDAQRRRGLLQLHEAAREMAEEELLEW